MTSEHPICGFFCLLVHTKAFPYKKLLDWLTKKGSIASIIVIVSVIILLSTGVMTTTTGNLFPIFALVALLNIVPLAVGRKKQKISAFVILSTSVFLAIWAFQGVQHERQMRERAQKVSEERQIHKRGGS